ncbi:MAG: OmpP1/FadL family transporter [Bacteroidota bacterium]
MKRKLAFGLITLFCGQLFAGGIVTNTNQSAQFVRLLSRNASTQIDAVYFNPAGLAHLSDGLHFSLNNQSIFQEKTVKTTFPLLNSNSYIGDVTVPFFPSFFGVYKKSNLAISFGFGPNGGGGSAEYSTGLPSFEMPVSVLPGMISALGIPTTEYTADISFDGSSVYWGAQFGASYALNDLFSLAGGVRLIMAKNTYEGHIRNVMINPTYPALDYTGDFVPAPAFFNAIGQPVYAAMTSDMEVDATQSGTAFTPFFGANINIENKLNIGLKYEMNTNLELTNESGPGQDAGGMFLNDSSFRSDIPAILAVGIEYMVMDGFRVSASYNSYFDKNADWEGREEFVDKNLYEIAVGMEYDVSPMVTVSAGFMHGETGVAEGYQTDISFSNSSNTVGFGGRLHLNENLSIDLGALITMYESAEENKSYATMATPIEYKETFNKSLMDFAIGVNYSF